MKYFKRFKDTNEYDGNIGSNVTYSVFPNVSLIKEGNNENESELEYNPVIKRGAYFSSTNSSVNMFKNIYNLKSVMVGDKNILDDYLVKEKIVEINSDKLINFNGYIYTSFDNYFSTNNLARYTIEIDGELKDDDVFNLLCFSKGYGSKYFNDTCTISEGIENGYFEYINGKRNGIIITYEYTNVLNNSSCFGFISYISRNGQTLNTVNTCFASLVDKFEFEIENATLPNNHTYTLPQNASYSFFNISTNEAINDNTIVYMIAKANGNKNKLGSIGELKSDGECFLIDNKLNFILFTGNTSSMLSAYFVNVDENGNETPLKTKNSYIISYNLSSLISYNSNDVDVLYDVHNRFEPVLFGNDVINLNKNSLHYVKNIYEDVFSDCEKLSSVEIPNTVTNILDYAFYGCSGLKSVILGKSVESIGDRAFYNCTNLESIEFYNSLKTIGWMSFYGCEKLKTIELPNTVISIDANSFGKCSSLKLVTIPNSVTSIGYNAFSGCTSLPIIDNIRYAGNYIVEVIDKTLSSYNIKEGTKWVGSHAFSGCTNLTSITIPDSVTSIGDYAFSNCSSLNSIEISNSITSIGYKAFSGCTLSLINNSSLDAVSNSYWGATVYDIVTEEGLCVSSNTLVYLKNKNITTAIIPESVTTLSNNIFNGCFNLTAVTLPSSLTTIGDRVFANCSGLTSITCLAITAPNLGNYPFLSVGNSGTLRIPTGSDYSSWVVEREGFLGWYGWSSQEVNELGLIENLIEYVTLSRGSENYYFTAMYPVNSDLTITSTWEHPLQGVKTEVSHILKGNTKIEEPFGMSYEWTSVVVEPESDDMYSYKYLLGFPM